MLPFNTMTSNGSNETIDTLGGPPEAIEFLVGSWNRFEVLEALGSSPRTRDELREMTGVSRPTLSRILSDLGDYGWILRHNDEFEATPMGRVIASEMSQLVDDIGTAGKLNGALNWLPTELLGFDLAALADAEVLTPRLTDQTGPMRQLSDFISTTSQIRSVASGVTYEIVDGLCQAGVAGELRIRCVLDDQGLDGIRAHSDLAEAFSEMVERGDCEAYHYIGEGDLIDCNLLDDVVMFCGYSDDGRPAGILVADDATVRSWMAYYFESLCEESVSLQADSFMA